MKESIHSGGVQVPLPSGAVEVKELRWPDALKLYRSLADQSKVLIDGEGRLVLSLEKMLELIQQNIELGAWLVLQATGKDAAWLNERTASEVLDLVTEAAALNVGIIMGRLKNAQGRLRGLLPQPPSAPSSELNTKPQGSTGSSPT